MQKSIKNQLAASEFASVRDRSAQTKIAAGNRKLDEAVAVPGQYRVERTGLVDDGEAVLAGTILDLDRGGYDFARTRAQEVTLRWAAAGEPVASETALSALLADY
ncbi:MAG: hypothetical protein QNI87_00510 [Erythrobacter sp.]|uniref:hypothetical protein n=1 Tax=Erythrobacter sp. TaxID=1042 RepID=UPI002626CBD3|nr:hypothetical protein [Erythrobacter sp.]MDJ0976998.1 hypothetical protein [Erythrobacter sp.]